MTLTTRLSQESSQFRNEAFLLRQAEQEADFRLLQLGSEASLLRQAEQEADFRFQAAQHNLRNEINQSEQSVLAQELHLNTE